MEHILRPEMTDAEIELFGRIIQGKKNLLEFGCGGSTVFTAMNKVPNIVSVDSDHAWIDKISNVDCIKSLLETGNIKFFHVDIGETTEWGYPKNDSKIREWHKYWLEIWKKINPEDVDCMLVDGRFRVACVLFGISKLASGVPIIIHDFWRRPHYHVITKYLFCIASVDNLAVFITNQNFVRNEMFEDLIRYSFDPR